MREEFIFPPPADRRSPFRLHLAGSSFTNGNYRIRMNKTDFYCVFEYVERGRGTLVVDGREFFPEAGDVYIVPVSGERAYWSDPADPWIKHWFNVSGPYVTELLRLYSLENVHLVRNFSRPELFYDGLARLRKQPELSHLPLGPDILGGIIASIAADVRDSDEVFHLISEEGRLMQQFLEKNIFGVMPSLAELARLINRSEAQTIRIFRRDFDETPYQYLLKRKLAAARELLHCTRRTIKQIADDLCFSNEYYFAGLFKKKTGYSPGLYRRTGEEGKVIESDLPQFD